MTYFSAGEDILLFTSHLASVCVKAALTDNKTFVNEGGGCQRRKKEVRNPSLSVFSVFVVGFVWDNVIKAAGRLNWERKLGYICSSFSLKWLLPTCVLLQESTVYHIKACHSLITFAIILAAVKKYSPNHNRKRGKMLLFDGILIWCVFKRIDFTALLLLLSKESFIWEEVFGHNSQVELTGCMVPCQKR